MKSIQVMIQVWLVAAYLLQIPALHDRLIPAGQPLHSSPSISPLAFGSSPIPGSPPLWPRCPDGIALTRSLLWWMGLPLGQEADGDGGDGDGGRSLAARQLCALIVLQCLILAIAALRAEAGG